MEAGAAADEPAEVGDGDVVAGLMATWATICCASTSSGLRRKRVDSMSPSIIRRTTTAASSRSPRCFGIERALARLADGVPGAADALQAAAHRTWRLDLDDEIDRAHVDAELEAASGDDAAQGRRASARPR